MNFHFTFLDIPVLKREQKFRATREINISTSQQLAVTHQMFDFRESKSAKYITQRYSDL